MDAATLAIVAALERLPGGKGMMEAAVADPEAWVGTEVIQSQLADYLGLGRDTESKVTASAATPLPDNPAASIPDDLFSVVTGLEGPKRLLNLALRAKAPVHVLMVGDPASAKSMFLMELTRLVGARIAVAGNTTRAGIIQFLLDNPCRYLLLDELDKANWRDLAALLPIMEGGLITRMREDGAELRQVPIWVFAAANSTRRLSAALLSRFVVMHLKPYTPEQSRRVMANVLSQREGLPPALAVEVAAIVARRSRNPRRAVQVARLAQGDHALARSLALRVGP